MKIMSEHQDIAGFYDELADDYHLIFADWNTTIARQGALICGLLREHHALTGGTVLDASCGIGTQALGLAGAGFAVTATDVSAASVERCAREAQLRGLPVTTAVADVRSLEAVGDGQCDAAVSFDNALPHLLDDDDLRLAAESLRRVLRPGGALLASIRDYDAMLLERPSGELPRRFSTGAGERIVFQAWEWTADDRYTVRHFIMDSRSHGWQVAERRTTYRALSRATLSDALEAAGFEDVTWLMPEQSGFYQPVVSARARS